MHLIVQAFRLSGKEGIHETGKDRRDNRTLVRVNPAYFRPAEVEVLWGDPAKAEKELGWKRQISFEQLVERMVKNDMELVKKEVKAGYR